MKRLGKDLQPGDVIIWSWHEETGSRHHSGPVLSTRLYDPPCVFMRVYCTGEWFDCGKLAEFDVEEKL